MNVFRFFANVHVNAFFEKNSLFQAKDIMIEFIKEYSLSDLAKNEPQSASKASVTEPSGLSTSLATTRFWMRTSNHTISWYKNRQTYFITDFAQCRFRGDYKSEADWKHEKWRQDEKGSIEHVMARKLKGAVEYKLSYCYLCECSKCTDVRLRKESYYERW